MAIGEPAETVAAIHRLKQQIDTLNEHQAKALKTATFVGMTPDEAQEYDERRSEITELVKQLDMLTRAQ